MEKYQESKFSGCYSNDCNNCIHILEIKESNIPKAQLGVFATNDITCSGWVEYIGNYTTNIYHQMANTHGKYPHGKRKMVSLTLLTQRL